MPARCTGAHSLSGPDSKPQIAPVLSHWRKSYADFVRHIANLSRSCLETATISARCTRCLSVRTEQRDNNPRTTSCTGTNQQPSNRQNQCPLAACPHSARDSQQDDSWNQKYYRQHKHKKNSQHPRRENEEEFRQSSSKNDKERYKER